MLQALTNFCLRKKKDRDVKQDNDLLYENANYQGCS